LNTCAEHVSDKVELPKEMILAWNAVKGSESPKNRMQRVNTVRAFSEYLSRRGVPAFVCTPLHFFPTTTGEFYKGNSIYGAFRKFLWDAGISHGGRGKGPRVHDLRHTFAVHCLRKWVRNGNDINASVPYLAAYMGHTHFRHSQVYVRLTADIFPDIVAKLEQNFDVFPEWEGIIETD